MKKIIGTAFFLIILLILSNPVYADKIAGNSAVIAYNTNLANRGSSIFLKKLAIRRVLEKYDAPLADESDSFINTCQRYDLDCYLLPSIAGLESTFGRFIYPYSYNPFGWARGYMMFKSWAEGIETVGRGLRKNYLDKGALSVSEIGPIYSESPTWSTRVQYFINEFHREETKLQLYLNQEPVEL